MAFTAPVCGLFPELWQAQVVYPIRGETQHLSSHWQILHYQVFISTLVTLCCFLLEAFIVVVYECIVRCVSLGGADNLSSLLGEYLCCFFVLLCFHLHDWLAVLLLSNTKIFFFLKTFFPDTNNFICRLVWEMISFSFELLILNHSLSRTRTSHWLDCLFSHPTDQQSLDESEEK